MKTMLPSTSSFTAVLVILNCHVLLFCNCQFIRREYRMLSDGERNAFHNRLQQMKSSGQYDQFSRQHLSVAGTGEGAHKGPAFLPWHREFLARFENALGMAIPYWDSVMDSYLPNPRDSMMFTDMFMGSSDGGAVFGGPGGGWRTLEGRTLTRRLGGEGRLLSENVINNVLNSGDITGLLGYTAPRGGCRFGTNLNAIEYHHSSVHLWLGGDMRPPTTSCNDPIFWPVHSFVDYIWEMWRQSRQSRQQRENDYPPDDIQCSTSNHFANAPMIPLGLRNIDGLSNRYTDQMYRYAPRPQCPCNSPYLFCSNRGFPHCVAKVRPGGQCSGFENEDVCYNGVCRGGFCQGGQNFQEQNFVQQSFAPPPPARRRRPTGQPPRQPPQQWNPGWDNQARRAPARRPQGVRRRQPARVQQAFVPQRQNDNNAARRNRQRRGRQQPVQRQRVQRRRRVQRQSVTERATARRARRQRQ